MEHSQRTKRRKIAAKVAEHVRLVAQQIDQPLDFNLEAAYGEPLEDVPLEIYHDSVEDVSQNVENECATDIFYDAFDDDIFNDFENGMPADASDFDLESSDSEDAASEKLDDTRGLAERAAEYNISQNALSALLKILKQKGLNVPLDARTLMCTERKCNVKNVAGGSYYHFGISNSVVAELASLDFDLRVLTDTLTLRIHMDGLPLFRSTTLSLWPILARIKEIPNSNVFMIGLYSGVTKPSQLQEYLNEFIQDFKAVIHEGIQHNGGHRVTAPDAFICDAPARVFLKCVKGHTGYYACERCTQKGLYLNRRLCFPELTSEQRTDEKCRDMGYEGHQVGVSPFCELGGVALVSSFVLDYMQPCVFGSDAQADFSLVKRTVEMQTIFSNSHCNFSILGFSQAGSTCPVISQGNLGLS